MDQFDSIIIEEYVNTAYDLLNLIQNLLTKTVFTVFTRSTKGILVRPVYRLDTRKGILNGRDYTKLNEIKIWYIFAPSFKCDA